MMRLSVQARFCRGYCAPQSASIIAKRKQNPSADLVISSSPHVSLYQRWPARTLTRSFSRFTSASNTEHQSNDQDSLAQTTNFHAVAESLMDRRKHPLGTLSWAEWDHRVTTLHQLLDGLPTSSENSQEWTGIGMKLRVAEDLFVRLNQEAATRSFASQHFLRQVSLLDTSLALLQSWLRLNQVFPKSPLVLDFAQSRFFNVLGALDVQSDSRERLNVTRQALIDLTRAWFQLGTAEGLDKGVLLLCSDMVLGLIHGDESVVSLYHESLQHVLDRVGAEELAGRLFGHMKHLAESHSLERIHPSLERIQIDLDTDNATTNPPQVNRATTIEQMGSILRLRQVMSILEKAIAQDDQISADAIACFESLESKDMREQLSLALVEYHLRFKDVVNAAPWLSRLDYTAAKNHNDDVLDLLGQAFILWLKANEEDPSGIYRAEEIIQLMDLVRGQKPLDPKYRLALAASWLKRPDEPGAADKAAKLVFVPGCVPSYDFLKVALTVLQMSSSEEVSRDKLDFTYRWFQELNDKMDDKELIESAEPLLVMLSNRGQPGKAVTCLELIQNRGLSVSPRSLDSLLRSSKLNRKDFLRVVDKLRDPDNPGIAFVVLKNLPLQENAYNTLEAYITKCKGEIGLAELFAVCIDKLVEWKHLEKMRDLLEYFEVEAANADPKIEVPLACYEKAILALGAHGLRNDASEIFLKLRTDTASDRLPDTEFCWKYMSTLTGHKAWMFQECQNVLKWLVEKYRISQDKRLKPNAPMFQITLLYLSHAQNLRPSQRYEAAVQLIYEMCDISAHGGSTAAFHQAMQIALETERWHHFERVFSLFEIIRNTDGLEVDSKALHKLLWSCMSGRLEEERRGIKLKVALDAFRLAREKQQVSEESYFLLLRTTEKLANETEMAALVEKVFQMCCVDGLLSKRLEEEARRLMSQPAWDRVFVAQTGERDVKGNGGTTATTNS